MGVCESLFGNNPPPKKEINTKSFGRLLQIYAKVKIE